MTQCFFLFRLKRKFHFALLPFLIFCSSCASVPVLQPQINVLIVNNRFDEAFDLLNSKENAYGANNQLLYLLDKAYVLHMAGRYEESIKNFARAKQKFDDLYTQSISKLAATLIVNDYSAPYRGEDFEYVLTNIFQALNYAALGNISEALVEARDLDRKLKFLRDLFYDKKNAYKEDAFGEFLSGILYQASGSRQDLNDAFICYKKALAAYENSLKNNDYPSIPALLIENLLATAESLGFPEFAAYKLKFPFTLFTGLKDLEKKSQIYLVHYNGLSPIKHPVTIPIPLPDGFITQLSFPHYDTRPCDIIISQLSATSASGETFKADTILGSNIEKTAIQNLEARKFRVYATALGRPVFKYLLEKGLEKKVEERHGRGAGNAVKGVGSLYNIFSERADLRSWQTLPAQIRITRLILTPGTYKFSMNNLDNENAAIENVDLGEVNLKTGETKFIIYRTTR